MNTKLAYAWGLQAWRLLLLLGLALFASSLTACASKPEARGYVQGKAGIQVYKSEEPDADPITAPYEIEGNFKFVANPWRKPYLTITADPSTVIRTVYGGVPGRIDGAGATDEGKTLIIRK